MNILFLDIDGVLNSANTTIGLGKSYPGESTNFDPCAIGMLKDLDNKIGFHVYFQSTWRRYLTNEELHNIFKTEYGWDIRILDRFQERFSETRVTLINRVITELKPDSYVIIDDKNMQSFGDRMIRTDPMIGFCYYDYAKICSLYDIKTPVFLF